MDDPHINSITQGDGAPTRIKRARPKYRPCVQSADGKHKFERLKHNQFEKCMNCGEPRFALVEQRTALGKSEERS
jgi:hypothetical protein